MRNGISEMFDFYGQLWDVDKAIDLVTGRRPDVLVIDEVLARESRASDLAVDRERAVALADLSNPVLVIPLPPEIFGDGAGDLVIDGWHRIVRAVREGVHQLPAFFLTPTDESTCRSGETWDSFTTFEPWHAQQLERDPQWTDRPLGNGDG